MPRQAQEKTQPISELKTVEFAICQPRHPRKAFAIATMHARDPCYCEREQKQAE